MDSGITFTPAAATRIANATRWAELQQGMPADGYGESAGNGMVLVRTGTLPADYTGAMAAPGNIIEKLPDGTVQTLAPIWLKDINGIALGSETIYQARYGGSFTKDVTVNGIVTPTTYGLFLVQLNIIPYEYHYVPASFTYFSDNLIFINGTNYLLIGFREVILAPYQTRLSDFATYNRVNQIKIAYRKTKITVKYNEIIYYVYDWYSIDSILLNPVRIFYSTALKDDGSSYNVSVVNPFANIVGPYGFWTVSPGYYNCIYRISSVSNYTPFMDQLFVVSKVADLPTTGGIGSGIGSGISGV